MRDTFQIFPYLGRKERTIFLTFLKGIIISLKTSFPPIEYKYGHLIKMTCECSSIMWSSSVISYTIILIKRNDPGEIISNKLSLWCHIQKERLHQSVISCQVKNQTGEQRDNKCLISHMLRAN